MARADLPYARGEALIREYRDRIGDKTLLGFSRGKDSIATALALRDKLDVYPVYFFTIPGLSFIEEALDYYSRRLFNGRRIMQYPEGAFYKWWATSVYQTPHTMKIIEAADLVSMKHEWWREVTGYVIDDEGLPESTLAAVGIRARDSPFRWMNVKSNGVIRPLARNWLPIWDYPLDRVTSEIERAGISLPLDYLMFGRSFGGGLDARYLVPLKRHRPKDWQIVLEYFPLADVCVWKYEKYVEQRGNHETPARKRITRLPLAFLPRPQSPWKGYKVPERNEDILKAEVGAVHNAMVSRLKQEKERKALAVDGGDYFTVAFENSEQARAFLRAAV